MSLGKQKIRKEDDVLSFKHTIGRACIRIGELCEFSLLQRIPLFQQLVRGAVKDVETAAAKTIATLQQREDRENNCDNDTPICLIQSIQQSIQEATTVLLESPWPYHRPNLNWSQSGSDLRLASFTPSHALWVYTIRLAVTFTVSLLLYMFLAKETHSNWFPMTIAFVSTSKLEEDAIEFLLLKAQDGDNSFKAAIVRAHALLKNA